MSQPSSTKKTIPVMEAFYTIQGEGAFTGVPAYFIRLGGCDVGCVWCDVKESWEASDHPQKEISELVKDAKSSGSKISVITGGEPLMYDLNELTQELKASDLQTNMETSGAYPLTGDWDWICFSPKKFKKPLGEFYQKSHELKVVVFNKSDLAWAETHAQKMNPAAKLFLQPEWSKEKEMLPLIVEYVKSNPHWRISLQTHKYMDVP